MIKGGTGMAQYKFRTEHQDDIDELEEALEKEGVQYEIVKVQRPRPELPLVGDRVVTISTTASLGRVREVMRQVPDRHDSRAGSRLHGRAEVRHIDYGHTTPSQGSHNLLLLASVKNGGLPQQFNYY